MYKQRIAENLGIVKKNIKKLLTILAQSIIMMAELRKNKANKTKKGEIDMKTAEEIRKEITSSETVEVAKILESLDENSVVLARTYMMALSDRQRMEKARLEAAVV